MGNPRESSGLKPEPLIVSRTFPAPRELVFSAWSRADHIKRWFSPEGCSVPEAEVDFRAGGAFVVCMRLPDASITGLVEPFSRFRHRNGSCCRSASRSAGWSVSPRTRT